MNVILSFTKKKKMKFPLKNVFVLPIQNMPPDDGTKTVQFIGPKPIAVVINSNQFN